MSQRRRWSAMWSKREIEKCVRVKGRESGRREGKVNFISLESSLIFSIIKYFVFSFTVFCCWCCWCCSDYGNHTLTDVVASVFICRCVGIVYSISMRSLRLQIYAKPSEMCRTLIGTRVEWKCFDTFVWWW